MLINRNLKKNLEEIKEITKIDTALFTEKGELLVTTFQEEENFGEKIQKFTEAQAEVLMLEGCYFFRIVVMQTQEVYVLVAKTSAAEAYMIGRMAACQVRNLLEIGQQYHSRNGFLQQILHGDIREEEIYERAKKMQIASVSRVVYVIKTKGKRDTACVETLKNLFEDGKQDFILEIDERSIVFMKDVRNIQKEEELEAVAQMISDNIQSEAMQMVTIGYGRTALDLKEISRSYQEALLALEIGRIFYETRDILSYSRLGIGKLVYQLPKEVGEKFLEEIFEGKEENLDEESLETIQRFFANDLNISETARQMYIHRNTLVYRLERIEKAVGLDVRKFEDAMKFKMALMIRASLDYQKNKKE